MISDEAIEDHIGPSQRDRNWPPVKRAALSHAIRTRRNVPIHSGTKLPMLDSATLQGFEERGIYIPSAREVARNIVRALGNHERQTGERMQEMPPEFYAVVGAASQKTAEQIALDLADQGRLRFHKKIIDRPQTFMDARLTLAGWDEWEALQHGERATGDGFIAMQFGDDRLDKFVAEVIQKGVKDQMGCAVHRVDSPDKVQAGLIDNIMREAIQDARFVLVELSHGNRGAYWEAGFAEGLGKPVVYLCEQAVWEKIGERPHFDVNHRTTVMWKEDEPDDFLRRLIPTIRNSLRRP